MADRELQDANPAAKDELKTLPLPELEKRLASSPGGLSQAEAEKRLAEYGPNEIEEKKTNPFLKFLSYFWGPIPWMIEVAVILSAVVRHWADFGIILVLLVCQRRRRILGRAPGGQRHRRLEGQAGAQGPREARMANGSRRRPANWCPATSIRLRLGDIVPADARLLDGRPGGGRSIRPDGRIVARHAQSRAKRCFPARSCGRAKSTRWSMPPARTPISARRRNWCRRRTPSAISNRRS